MQSLQSQLNALRATIHLKPHALRPNNSCYQVDPNNVIDSHLNATKSEGADNFTWQKATPFSKRLHRALAKLVDVSHLSASKNQRESEDNGPEVLFDSGANCCITNNQEDFHGTYSPCSETRHITGIDHHLVISTCAQLKTNRSIEDSVFVDIHKLGIHTCKTL